MGLLEAMAMGGGNPMTIIGAVAAVVFVGVAYIIITIDRMRATSPSKDDTQVGLKLVLFGLILAGVQLVAAGATSFLSSAFGGFKGGSMPVRAAIPPIIVGVAVIAVMLKMMLPRTNWTTHKQPERYLVGALGIQFGVMAILGVSGLLNGLFLEAPWAYTSSSLASTVVSAAIAFLAVTRLGAASGWTQPPPPVMQAPPQAGPGYPPQGGGYPPQGGGYPPQGGGYPPQGGGYPPQGGGYPPQGGGGYPPQGGGGGYPPR